MSRVTMERRGARIAHAWPERRCEELAAAIMRDDLAFFAQVGGSPGTLRMALSPQDGSHEWTAADVAERWYNWRVRPKQRRDLDSLVQAWETLRP